jgi:hypothetical protein
MSELVLERTALYTDSHTRRSRMIRHRKLRCHHAASLISDKVYLIRMPLQNGFAHICVHSIQPHDYVRLQ